MYAQTRESQYNLTPQEAKEILIQGNKRFVEGNLLKRQFKEQMKQTYEDGQFPHSVILGCIDSRATSEQIFDQGIGSLFNTRIAGNVIDDDILGSLEYSCKLAGSKLIVVLGHTFCGAVTGACKGVKIGHVTTLLEKINPAIEKVKPLVDDITSREAINLVSKENVYYSIQEIRKQSDILRTMEKNGEIEIVGAMYYIESGVVTFL